MFRIGRVRVSHLQSGQALIVAVLAMTALIGMVAMTVDVGMLLHNRRHYQNSADAMALAGVAELPTNPGLAITNRRRGCRPCRHAHRWPQHDAMGPPSDRHQLSRPQW